MYKHLLAIAVLAAAASLVPSTPAAAQGCGSKNPNCIVPLAPPGDASNRAASTLWVTQNAGGGGGAGVTSWNGRAGVVVPAANDYNFTQIGPGLLGFNQMPAIAANQTYINTGTTVAGVTIPNCVGNQQSLLYDNTAHTFSCNTISPIVGSVFGRSGNVTAQNGDYSFAQISGQITLTQMPTAPANSVFGNASGANQTIAVPSCSGTNQALTWTTNTGYGCATIAGSGGTPLPSIAADSVLGNPTATPTNSLVGMQFPACSNPNQALQYVIATHSFACVTISSSANAGGTNGQIQYNNNGPLGGFTMGGDATTNTTTGALTIAAGAVTNAKLATMPANTVKANATGTTAAPTDFGMPSCSAASSVLQWLSGTGFQCGTVGAAGANTQVQFNNAGALAGSPGLTWNGTVLSMTSWATPLCTSDANGVTCTSSTSVQPHIQLINTTNDNNSAVFDWFKGRGSQNGAVQSGDVIISLNAHGGNGSSSPVAAQFLGKAGELWTGTANGAFIDLTTTPLGATIPVIAMRVQPSGGVSIGAPLTDGGTGTLTLAGNPVPVRVASGTAALGTGAIASATCATAVTVAATGVATTDVVTASFNGDPTAVTGYIPLTTGMLVIIPYPTANNVNFKVCNNTSASITPGAITLNWRVVR